MKSVMQLSNMQERLKGSVFPRALLLIFMASGLGIIALPAYAEGNLTSLGPMLANIAAIVLAVVFAIFGAMAGIAISAATKKKKWVGALAGAFAGWLLFSGAQALKSYQEEKQWQDGEHMQALAQQSDELLSRHEYDKWIDFSAHNKDLDAVSMLSCAPTDEPDFVNSNELSDEQNRQAYLTWSDHVARKKYALIKGAWQALESSLKNPGPQMDPRQLVDIRQLFLLLTIRHAEWEDVDAVMAAGAKMDDGGLLEQHFKVPVCSLNDLLSDNFVVSFNPLRQAWAGGRESGVAKALERGAQVNRLDANGENILFSDLTPALIDQLVASGANVNQESESGPTPLLGHLSISLFLHKNDYGLRKETVEERVERVQALLRNGARTQKVYGLKFGGRTTTACEYLENSWEDTGYKRVYEAQEEMSQEGLTALKLYQALKAQLNGCVDKPAPKQ